MQNRISKGRSPKKAKAQSAALPCGRARPRHEKPAGNLEDLIASLVESFEAYCVRQGLRSSNARRKIVEVIVKDMQHFTSQELVLRMVQRHPDVGRATLYRTIPVLVSAGILQEGPKTLEGHPSYELAEARHHDHIVCLDCRAIFEFASPKIEKEQDQITHDLAFRPQHHTHVIYANCMRLARNKT